MTAAKTRAQKIGNVIRSGRQALGWSQTQLGNIVGVSKNAISRYERGSLSPGRETRMRLANALGMRFEDLSLNPNGSVDETLPAMITLWRQLSPKQRLELLAYVSRLAGENISE